MCILFSIYTYKERKTSRYIIQKDSETKQTNAHTYIYIYKYRYIYTYAQKERETERRGRGREGESARESARAAAR